MKGLQYNKYCDRNDDIKRRRQIKERKYHGYDYTFMNGKKPFFARDTFGLERKIMRV